MELFFECDGWSLWPLYRFLRQPTSDPLRTPLLKGHSSLTPLPLHSPWRVEIDIRINETQSDIESPPTQEHQEQHHMDKMERPTFRICDY